MNSIPTCLSWSQTYHNYLSNCEKIFPPHVAENNLEFSDLIINVMITAFNMDDLMINRWLRAIKPRNGLFMFMHENRSLEGAHQKRLMKQVWWRNGNMKKDSQILFHRLSVHKSLYLRGISKYNVCVFPFLPSSGLSRIWHNHLRVYHERIKKNIRKMVKSSEWWLSTS